MLARSGRLPTGRGWSFEVKWDGFRAIVSTEGALRVRSRRGWDITDRAAFLPQLPLRAILDGELVAFDEEGKPDFPLICDCVLHHPSPARLVFMAFDVLSVDGECVTSRSYSERRRLLEDMELDGPQWRTPETFDDGTALWHAVCEHELEGVLAKRRSTGAPPKGRGS